jgi:hypothetical protein
MFGFNRCEWPGNDIVETKSNRPLFLNNWVDNGNANPPPEFKLRDSDGGFFIADRIVSSFWSIRGYKSVVIGCVHAGGTGSGINLHGGNYDSQNNIWTPGFPNKTDLGVTPRGNAVATLIAGCTSAVGAVGGDPPSGRYGIVFPRACTIVAHSGSDLRSELVEHRQSRRADSGRHAQAHPLPLRCPLRRALRRGREHPLRRGNLKPEGGRG